MIKSLIVCSLLVLDAISIPTTPHDINFPSLVYTPPSLTNARDTLSNGIIVFTVPDSTLPVFDILVRIKGGALAETDKEMGVARAAFDLLPNGGTENIKPDSLDELIEFHALSVNSSAGKGEASITISSLSNKQHLSIEILSQLLKMPSFDKKRLETVKRAMLKEERARFDAPKRTAAILQTYANYGKNRLSDLLSEKEIKSISRKQIKSFYSRVITGENIIIGVSGKFNKSEILSLLEKNLGSIRRGGSILSYGTINPEPQKAIFFFDKKGLSQATIRIGLPTIKRPHPDYYPLTLMNYLLGGAPFTSRISKKIREEEGLAYSAGSSMSSEYFFPGSFSVYLETKSSTAAYAIQLVFNEIERFVNEGITDNELSTAKKSMVETFPSTFKNSSLTASAFSFNQFVGERDDRFDLYREKINAITKEEVMRVAKNYLVKEDMAIVVIGDLDSCLHHEATSKGASLKDYGEIKVFSEKELSAILEKRK